MKYLEVLKWRWSQLILVFLGYFIFSYFLVLTGISHDLREFSNIIMYYMIITMVLVGMLVYHSSKNISHDEYHFLQLVLYISFGLVALLGCFEMLYSYFSSYEYAHSNVKSMDYYPRYYEFFKSRLLGAKFFLVLALMWYNFRHHTVVETTKHILETIMLGIIFLTFFTTFSLSGSHNKLILHVLDTAITYYVLIYLFLSFRKNLMAGFMKSRWYIIPLCIGVMCTIIDIYAGLFRMTSGMYLLNFIITCSLYAFVLLMLVENEKAYEQHKYKIVDSMRKRTYISIKDTCTTLLDVALFVFVVNIMTFTSRELIIFIVGIVLIATRHFLIGLQRARDEYNLLEDNVVFINKSSKKLLFELGIDRADRLFIAKSRGVLIKDKFKNRVAYNRRLLALFQVDSPDEINDHFVSKDKIIYQERLEQAYQGIKQEFSIRVPLSKSDRKYMIFPCSRLSKMKKYVVWKRL